jgi:hypothetical protein
MVVLKFILTSRVPSSLLAISMSSQMQVVLYLHLWVVAGDRRVWTQEFILANQVLYPLSHNTTPLLWVFWVRVSRGYAGTGLDPQSTWCLSSAFQVAVIIGMGLLYLAPQLSNNSCSDSCAQTAGGLLFGTLHPQGKFVRTQDVMY